MARCLLLCLLVACTAQVVPRAARAFPMQPLMPHRRVVRSSLYHPYPAAYQAYPEAAPAAAPVARDPYNYYETLDYDDYGQGQWLDSAVSDAAANVAFMQDLMEANRLARLGVGAQYGRYQDPRYKDSDDYVFGSVTSSKAGPASRYQYRTAPDEEDDDQDVRDLHALAKKAAPQSLTDEQLLRDFEAQSILDAAQRRARERQERMRAEAEAQAEALAEAQAEAEAQADAQAEAEAVMQQQRQRSQAMAEALRQANQRAEEFGGDGNDAATLELAMEQGLERLFAKSGISNKYVPPKEERPWNGKDLIWNGYWMGEMPADHPASPYDPSAMMERLASPYNPSAKMERAASPYDTSIIMDHRASVSDRKKAPGVPSKRSGVEATSATKTGSTTKATTTSPASSSSSTTATTTTTEAPAAVKKSVGMGIASAGQPEVALLRPAAARSAPRPVARPAPHHHSGVDEIRSLLRGQDQDRDDPLLSLLTKRSAPKAIVSDEGSLVKELNALKKKSD